MVDVRGDVLRPPHGTTPAAVKSNIKSEMRSFKSNENIHKKEGGSYCPCACPCEKVQLGITSRFCEIYDERYGVLYRSSAYIAYLIPNRKVLHGCQIVHWDKLNENKSNPNKKVRILPFLWQRMSHIEK